VAWSARATRRPAWLPAAVVAAALLAPAPGLEAQSCPAGPRALVLSGGGARGMAQVGAIGALDSVSHRVDLVIGTSIGAVVGALYASGYDAGRVDSIANAVELSSIFRASQPLAPRAFGPVVPLLYWEEGRGGISLTAGSALEARVNSRLNRALLAGNLEAGGDFSLMPVPFAALAADLATREPVILRGGDLARAVRASSGIPLVLRPHLIEGRYLVDGGIADNVPLGVARSLGARSATIIDVTSGLSDSLDVTSTASVARRLVDHLMLDSGDSIGPGDLYIRPALGAFDNFDFSPASARRASRLGREAALAALDGLDCPAAPRPGRSRGPYRISSVQVIAPRQADRRFVQRAFGIYAGDTVSLERIHRAYQDLERSPEPREVWLNPSREEDGLRFDITLVPPPPRAAGMLLAYDHDYGGRIGGLFLDRTLSGGRFQFAAAVTLSRYQQRLRAALRPEPVSWNPLVPALHLKLGHDALRFIGADGAELPSLDVLDVEARLALERVVASSWALDAGPLLHYFDSDSGRGTAAGFSITARRGSELALPRVSAEAIWTTEWKLAAAAAAARHAAGGWELRVAGRFTATDLVPPEHQPTLGGSEGFPGYALFDLRGVREAFAELSAARRLLGPLEARVALAGGRAWLSHTDEWLGGTRLTVEIPTPAGSLRGGYGWATSGRGAVFVRLGAWF
jgi:predicted acylesterase/phospholipase RssA